MKLKPFLLPVSIVINFAFGAIIVFLLLQGTSETRNGGLGVLKKEIQIGRFGDSKKIFNLPKGLMVQDASASGADLFEPYRFRIVVTSERNDLVNYSINQEAAKAEHGEYYSADSMK